MTYEKLLQARLHDFPRRGQRVPRISRVSPRPKLRLDLKARNFAGGPYRKVVIAAFNH